MIRISDLEMPLMYDTKMLWDIAAKKLQMEQSGIATVRIFKRTVNATDKEDIHFKMTLDVTVNTGEIELVRKIKNKKITRETEQVYCFPHHKEFNKRPIVVGCGPAGLFAALTLAKAGANPILLERGQDVESRTQRVLDFWYTGVLDTESNVQFGEGGAGAFSDGKLKIGFQDARKIMILNELIEAGAPEEIRYVGKPHIGTDRLKETVKKIRKKIISLGGEVHFGVTVTDILRRSGKVTGVGSTEKGKYSEYATDSVILAIGHSARDTFERLLNSGIQMEQKLFAVGVRIEHPQQVINQIQYGKFAGHPSLGAADYRMVVHLKNTRGVYTFCMCPGGEVVASASEKNGLVTNGMSEYKRDGRNANTALLVTVNQQDLGSDHPLAGIAFQRKLEEAAFISGGGGYKAPVQRLEDFQTNRMTKAFGEVTPTYLPGTEFACVDSYLPSDIVASLRQGIAEMCDWMPGFSYPDALITGAETRSASPVKILRGESLEAVELKGLFPCGEGAGYAGGIISAAVDGVLCAEQIVKNHEEA